MIRTNKRKPHQEMVLLHHVPDRFAACTKVMFCVLNASLDFFHQDWKEGRSGFFPESWLWSWDMFAL